MTNQLYIENRNKRFITGVSKKNGKQELSLRVPYPIPYSIDADKFWKLIALGKELRESHSLKNPKVEEYSTAYPDDGDNIFDKPNFVKQPVTEHSKIKPNF